jgi:hypothetical protein
MTNVPGYTSQIDCQTAVRGFYFARVALYKANVWSWSAPDNTNDYENNHRRNYRRAELRQRNHSHPDKPT